LRIATDSVISNETVDLRCKHGSSGVDREGLIVSRFFRFTFIRALAGFDVSSLK
jgi:hypothetical protein